MRGLRFSRVVSLLVLALLGLWPQASRAEFLFFAGNPSDYQSTLNSEGLVDGNVLYNDSGLIPTGLLVQGSTQGGSVMDFQSPDLLDTPAGGQARVAGLDGMFSSMMINPDSPTEVFRALSLDVNPAQDATGSITFDIVGSDNLVHAVSVPVSPGLLFFGAIATGNDWFQSVSLTGIAAMTDIRQVRVALMDRPGGGGRSIGPLSPAVPEPSALALCSVGLGLLLLARPLRRWARPRSLAGAARCGLAAGHG